MRCHTLTRSHIHSLTLPYHTRTHARAHSHTYDTRTRAHTHTTPREFDSVVNYLEQEPPHGHSTQCGELVAEADNTKVTVKWDHLALSRSGWRDTWTSTPSAITVVRFQVPQSK
jgi:hypothetical protein